MPGILLPFVIMDVSVAAKAASPWPENVRKLKHSLFGTKMPHPKWRKRNHPKSLDHDRTIISNSAKFAKIVAKKSWKDGFLRKVARLASTYICFE